MEFKLDYWANAEAFDVMHIAIQADNIELLAKQLDHQGYHFDGPVTGMRRLPDGAQTSWRALVPNHDCDEVPMPVFIQYDNWTDTNAASTCVTHVAIAVHDIPKTVRIWATMLQTEPAECWLQTDIEAYCIKLPVTGGNIVFCSPIKPGTVATVLQDRGQCPFMVGTTGGREPLYKYRRDGSTTR